VVVDVDFVARAVVGGGAVVVLNSIFGLKLVVPKISQNLHLIDQCAIFLRCVNSLKVLISI
jgi:hypothetical protein